MPPACSAKPTAQYASMPIAYTMKFMVIVWPAFLERVNPVSTSAKPACMNITRNPATSVHTKLIDVELAAVCVATESILVAAAAACAMSATGDASRPTTSTAFLMKPFTVLLQRDRRVLVRRKTKNPRVHRSKREGIGNRALVLSHAALPETFDRVPQILWERAIIAGIEGRGAGSGERHTWICVWDGNETHDCELIDCN